MRATGVHRGGERKSGEAHKREVSMARTGSSCTRGKKHTHVASGKVCTLKRWETQPRGVIKAQPGETGKVHKKGKHLTG